MPRGALAKTGHLVSVPFPSSLLRTDVEVGSVRVEGVDLVRGEQTAAIAGGEGCKDFACAEVFSCYSVALKSKVENIAHHGNRRKVHAVDSG